MSLRFLIELLSGEIGTNAEVAIANCPLSVSEGSLISALSNVGMSNGLVNSLAISPSVAEVQYSLYSSVHEKMSVTPLLSRSLLSILSIDNA